MEKGQAIKVAVGVGAVGTALAYLGYSYYNQESDTANITAEDEKNSWLEGLWSNSNTEEDESENESIESVSFISQPAKKKLIKTKKESV